VHKTIDVAELRQRLPAVLDEVAREHASYALVGEGHLKAAIVPCEDFLRFQQFEDQRALEHFERLIARMAEQNADVSDEEIVADVKAALAEVRAGKHQRAAS
jgi:PHD/YefM family antitoxin component YafN of YafNO toxin-antitoxin module